MPQAVHKRQRSRPVCAPQVFASRPVALACCGILAFYAALLAAAWAGGDTLFGPRDAAIHDFSVFWAAGRLAAGGEAAAAYDWPRLWAAMTGWLGTPSTTMTNPFFYPPVFLLVVAPLGLLPYAAAAAIWLAGTLAAYLAAVRAILPGGTALIAALAAPAVLFNAMSGQNGLLTAALLGGALALLDTRPALAGLLIGLMCYKPQFGLLLPLFLAGTGRWRVFAAAAATVLALVAAAAAVFGIGTFAAFLIESAGYFGEFSRQAPLHWGRLASVYGLMRALGAGPAAGWAAQLAVAAAAAAASLAIAASRAPPAAKAAAVPVAAMLIAPYSELTDLAILTPAMAYLVSDGLARGFRRWEMATLIAAFTLPLVLILVPALRRLAGLESVAVLVGPLTCALLAAVIARRLPQPRSRGAARDR